VAGTGHGWLALFVALLTILDLELHHVPGLSRLDGHRYAGRMADAPDDESPADGARR
jgi:hypothetical protein